MACIVISVGIQKSAVLGVIYIIYRNLIWDFEMGGGIGGGGAILIIITLNFTLISDDGTRALYNQFLNLSVNMKCLVIIN